MRKLSLIFLIVLSLSQSKAQTCEADLRTAVDMCTEIIHKADSLQNALKGEVNTQQAIISEQKEQVSQLQQDLLDAKMWYKQPMFVSAVSFGLSVLLVAIIKK